MAHGPYSRFYHALMDEYPSVYRNDAQLGCFIRCLVLAEKFYPSFAPLPPRVPQLQALIRVGLVLVNEEHHTYTIRGLAAERERRSDAGRNASAVRWDKERNAKANLERDEKRKDEKSSANASNGTPQLFMGYGPKIDKTQERQIVERMKRETDEELYRRHPELRKL